MSFSLCIAVNVTTIVSDPGEVSSARLELLAILVLLLLIPLIVILVFLIKKYVLPKFRKPKPVLPTKKIIDLGRADNNAKRTFRLHSYQADDTKNLVPIFKPKKPIRVSPVFDPMWEPGKLPFLLPLPKVEPLYHDTLEDYLRARLPRRPSHLSLYSFDSVIFSTDPWIAINDIYSLLKMAILILFYWMRYNVYLMKVEFWLFV